MNVHVGVARHDIEAVSTLYLGRAFPLPDKPSVAVLPFDNLSGEPAQGYLADGLSESVITTLARILILLCRCGA